MSDKPSKAQRDELRRLSDAATPGPWNLGIHTEDDMESLKAWLGRMLTYNDKLSIDCLVHMEDGSKAPPVLDDVWSFVVPALTGNGPTSEQNAQFIAAAREAVPALLDALDAAERDRLAAAEAGARAMWEKCMGIANEGFAQMLVNGADRTAWMTNTISALEPAAIARAARESRRRNR